MVPVLRKRWSNHPQSLRGAFGCVCLQPVDPGVFSSNAMIYPRLSGRVDVYEVAAAFETLVALRLNALACLPGPLG